MKKVNQSNQAFIDGQNLYLGTTKCSSAWKIDLYKFRIFLKEKYHANEAYYFLGYINEKEEKLYTQIQKAGFILLFREHNSTMAGKKKGNVDTDIVFSIMEKLYKKEKFDKIILISGDGDYKKLINFLIEEKKLEKILFPNKKYASSLYKKIGSEYFDYLDGPGIKNKIELKKGLLKH